MVAVLFDTLRLSRTLREKGHFTAEQAETLAAAFGEATREDLATKADLLVLKSEMSDLRAELKTELAEVKSAITIVKAEIANLATKAELADLRAELKTDIAELRADILKWVVGAIGFQTAATLGTVVALVKIFAR